jgi:transglycosylase-like protein with SLT domain
MPVQLGLSARDDRGLGVRSGLDRRRPDSEGLKPGWVERRRCQRRRRQLRSAIFAAAALALPIHGRSSGLKWTPVQHLAPASGPRVSTTITSFVAGSLAHAYDELIAEASARFRVDPAIIRSVMQAESAFDPFAVSRVGAMGLMQLMPDIAKAYGVDDPFDPRQNIMAGTQILRELIDRHHGNLPLVLASYNAGAGVVATYGNVVPPFRETQGYVKRVTGLVADARRTND